MSHAAWTASRKACTCMAGGQAAPQPQAQDPGTAQPGARTPRPACRPGRLRSSWLCARLRTCPPARQHGLHELVTVAPRFIWLEMQNGCVALLRWLDCCTCTHKLLSSTLNMPALPAASARTSNQMAIAFQVPPAVVHMLSVSSDSHKARGSSAAAAAESTRACRSTVAAGKGVLKRRKGTLSAAVYVFINILCPSHLFQAPSSMSLILSCISLKS